jgi:hypothetical protein
VTLLVAGSAGPEMISESGLATLAAGIPAIAIGFAIIAMFWNAHVRWRRYRENGGTLSLLLSLLLVFLVLIYVFPPRAMAGSLAVLASGRGQDFAGGLGTLFTFYGAEFVAMAGTTAALFADALSEAPAGVRQPIKGEMPIWLILVATGIISTVLAAIGGLAAWFAPWLYPTLPLSIGICAVRWQRSGD